MGINKQIKSILKDIKNICNAIFSLNSDKREVLFLQVFSIIIEDINIVKSPNEFRNITNNVLKKFPATFECENSIYRCKLIEENLDDFKFSLNSNEQLMFIIKLFKFVIDKLIINCTLILDDDHDLYIINQLKDSLNHNLTKILNQNTDEYDLYKKLTSLKEFILDDVDNALEYFTNTHSLKSSYY